MIHSGLGGWGSPLGKQHWIWVLKHKDFHGQWRQEGSSRTEGKKEERHEGMRGAKKRVKRLEAMVKNSNCIWQATEN